MPMESFGKVEIPADFKYMSILLKGRPVHEIDDAFSRLHPKMPNGQRANQFAPFDALKGFHEAILSKEAMYEPRVKLNREAERELNRRLDILHNLTFNSRLARIHRPYITVTYFVPCADPQHDAFGSLGKYETVSGICWAVDPDFRHCLRIGDTVLQLADILKIENDTQLFNQPFDQVG
jgi:hypothetical protein